MQGIANSNNVIKYWPDFGGGALMIEIGEYVWHGWVPKEKVAEESDSWVNDAAKK